MVDRGRFFLYDYINPALDAGRYELTADIDLDANRDTTSETVATPVAAHNLRFNISAPRIKLPPDQVLMTYPPANSEGSYDSRLPQIVIKKRSLPWERAAGSVGDTHHGHTVSDATPWLALVVIAEGEGELVHDAPAAECFTPGTAVSGSFDSPTGSYLKVPESTVEKVFPTVADLEMLTHVREVNPDDTENAMGDDDGFLAVVIGNRTPEYDEVNCRPRSYMACLINLEGQLARLPKPLPPQSDYDPSDFFTNPAMEVYHEAVLTGVAVPLQASETRRRLDAGDGTALTEAVRRGELVFHDGMLVDRMGITRDGSLSVLGRLDETAFLDGDFRRLEPIAEITGQPAMRVKGAFGSFNFSLEHLIDEAFLRFPVLTSWRFTCSGAGSFEQLMQDLDVGLMGTKNPGGWSRQMPDCTSPPDPNATPGEDAPPSDLPLEVAETGHISMPHLTRTGIRGEAWYRGPFSPFQLHRDPVEESSSFPKLAHVSDHLRMMTPDGREDVSLAVAFETGRLLAMSQPSFLAAVHRWRLQHFVSQRRRGAQRDLVGKQVDLLEQVRTDFDRDAIEAAIKGAQIQYMMEAGLLGTLGENPHVNICTPRDIADPGQSVAALAGEASRLLADGLGIPRNVVAAVARDPFSEAALHDLSQTKLPTSEVTDVGLTPEIDGKLENRLDQGLHNIAQASLGGKAVTESNVKNIKPIDNVRDLERDIFGGNR